jgi:hypothetical protein
MTDSLELNIKLISGTLRKQAAGFRRFAGESLDREFQTRLLALALDYERQAENLFPLAVVKSEPSICTEGQ